MTKRHSKATDNDEKGQAGHYTDAEGGRGYEGGNTGESEAGRLGCYRCEWVREEEARRCET